MNLIACSRLELLFCNVATIPRTTGTGLGLCANCWVIASHTERPMAGMSVSGPALIPRELTASSNRSSVVWACTAAAPPNIRETGGDRHNGDGAADSGHVAPEVFGTRNVDRTRTHMRYRIR